MVSFRLITVALALMVGSPLCWCCQAPPVKMAGGGCHSCCHSEDAKQPGGHRKEKTPCTHSSEKRLAADTSVRVPPVTHDLVAWDFHDPIIMLLQSPRMEMTVGTGKTDTPRLRSLPLFVTYCAYLT
jgi:hypothetical protein